MPRQARLDTPGTLHHVIIRGIERKKIVSDNSDRENFVSRMGEVAEQTQTIIYAWALLTNHAHILLRSGPKGLSNYMRRILTGYATSYNLRHRRHGHLFQNRYKSIVCDEDSYFTELVRYIHLNPLRVGLVKTIVKLDSYDYCGHSVVMGKKQKAWQDRDYVLSWFGKKEGEARRAYRDFVKQGMSEGKRMDLVGGGLIRSMGGWSEVLAMRSRGEHRRTDERILGSGAFVEQLLKEADEEVRNRFSAQSSKQEMKKLIDQRCERKGITVVELQSGSRRSLVSQVRFELVHKLVKKHGIVLAEVARQLGVSTSAIAKVLKRAEK